MRILLTVIFIAIAVTFSIDSIREGNGIDEIRVLRSVIDKAKMKNFTDSLYGYTITYPDFLQPSEDNQPGDNSFSYHGRTDIIVETSVEESIDEWKSHVDEISHKGNAVIMTGNYFEGDSTFENIRFHTKAIRSAKRWITFTVVYDRKYEIVIRRIEDTIDLWHI